MKLKDLLRWITGREGWIVISNDGFAFMSSELMIFVGHVKENFQAFHAGRCGDILEHFGKGNIMYVRDEDDSKVVLASSSKELVLENEADGIRNILAPNIRSACKAPIIYVAERSEFLGKTTHIKYKHGNILRGFVEDGKWRCISREDHNGWVYDVRVVNEILRDYPDIGVIHLGDMGGPLFIQAGDARVHLSREVVENAYTSEQRKYDGEQLC